MKRTREQKGITLVALIITIVVLLILAAVAISRITNENILNYAQNATKDYNQAGKNEQVILALNEWKIEKQTQTDKTFKSFLEEKFGAENVVDNGDGTYNITLESGDVYKVKEDGNITSAKRNKHKSNRDATRNRRSKKNNRNLRSSINKPNRRSNLVRNRYKYSNLK